MKTKGSFGRTVSIWIITVLIVTVFAVGSSALICRTQIGEAISYHRLAEQNDRECDMPYQNELHEKDVEKGDALLKQLTPLTTTQKAAVIIIGTFWVAVILLYWFSVTSLLAERAELIKFNRHFWFWFAFFTNIVAVAVFTLIKKACVKKCPKCDNYQVGGFYCTECGAALDIRCSQCGKFLKPGTSYCPQCGKKASKEED